MRGQYKYTSVELLDQMRRASPDGRTLSASMFEEAGGAMACTVRLRFGKWSRALREAGLKSPDAETYSDAEMIADLQRVARRIGSTQLSGPVYLRHGRIARQTIQARFGSWVKAIAAANLTSPYGTGIYVPCLVCGATFRKKSNGPKARKTCSQTCTSTLMSQHRTQPLDTITPQAARGRARRGMKLTRCSDCGVRTRLEVHHRDRNPYNNARENLEVLCVRCHKRRHRGEPRKRRRTAA